MTDHVLDDLEAYALGALDQSSAERVAAHLAVCSACRAEAAGLAEVVAALPETIALRDPDPRVREQVIAAARAETTGAPRPGAERRRFGRVRLAPVAIAGLAALSLVLAAADADLRLRLDATRTDRDSYYGVIEAFREGGRVWYMAGRDAFAGSGGTLVAPRAEGKPPFVLFHDLPGIPAGKVLTIWLVSPDSTWARAATFVPAGADVQAVQINLPVAGFDRCAVTLDDSPWGAHGRVVMESRIAPPPGG